MKKLNDQQVLESWKSNVNPWVSTVRMNEIESRHLIQIKQLLML